MEQPNSLNLSLEIVARIPDAILFADREGIIRLWNKGAERIFGFPVEAAIGQSLDLIIPEALRARHWEGYHQTMKTGMTSYGDKLLAVPGMRKDGSKVSTEFSIALLMDDQDRPIGVAAILRDVTEKWKKEKELRDRLAKLEANAVR